MPSQDARRKEGTKRHHASLPVAPFPIVSRSNINGSLTVSDIVGNRYLVQTYYGYTKREAVALFRQYVKEQTANPNKGE